MAQGDKLVTLDGLKAVYQDVNGNIDGIKSALNNNNNVIFPSDWTESAYYTLSDSNNTIDIASPKTTGASAYRCMAVPCKEGDVFWVTVTGSGTARPYAFLSSASGTNNIIKRPASTDTALANRKITAPHGTAYAIFNANKNYTAKVIMALEDKKAVLTSIDIPFEVGNIDTSDPSGPKYKTNNSGRARTPEGYTLTLHTGDVVGMSDYTDARFYVGWYDTENTFHSTNIQSADYVVTQDGSYIFLLRNATEQSILGNINALTDLFFVRINVSADQIYNEAIIASKRYANNIETGLNHPLFRLASPKMAMHRGYSSLAPENTIPAFELAGQHGAWGIETDIYETTDGHFVCHHDGTVDRMTDGTGDITEMSLAQIEALTIDAGSNIGEYTGLKIPTIEEYLAVCRRYGCACLIEIKGVTNIENLFSVIKSGGMENNTIILTQNNANIPVYRFYTKSPIFLVGTSSSVPSDMVDQISSYPNVGVDYNDSVILSAAPIVLAHSNNMPVIVWTTDNTQRADELIRLGADVVTSNSIPVLDE